MLAVAEKAHVSVMDALPHLAGMLMVLITLTILWGVCALTAKLIQVLMPERAPAPPRPQPAAAAQVNPAAPERISPELVAVIAAAVATATGRSHRIISIKRQSTHWEKAGRQSVLTSHRIR
jgi:sodium pump decarboxylase gamma subunit